jgi:hypothetical protein
MLCTEYTVVNIDADTIVAQPLYCKCWHCDTCAPRRKSQLTAQAHAGKPDTFITLTVNPYMYHSPDERAKNLAHAWQKAVKRIKRKYRLKSLPFIAVFEKTKRGEPHLHILCRSKWIDQKWLSDTMREFINAPVVDIRRVKDRSTAAKYITKYLAKDPEKFKGTKRYWQTRDYQIVDDPEAKEDPVPGGRWEIREMVFEQYCEVLELNGYDVDVTARRAVARLKRPQHPPNTHLLQRKPT